jgi:alkylhydroperoxidase/carboxymuconolactone decarboxylase family protein YurZ
MSACSVAISDESCSLCAVRSAISAASASIEASCAAIAAVLFADVWSQAQAMTAVFD